MATESSSADLPEPLGERHTLQPHEELRLEMPFAQSATATLTLQKGSCELWGCELALKKTYSLANAGLQIALFTWHGCVVDVGGPLDISYVSQETDANVCAVNTHAQLEAMRDDALRTKTAGPRVMVVGPPESGKTRLCQTLVAYACKLGRTPLWVDLDPNDNAITAPGTLSVAPMILSAITVESYGTCGIPPNTAHPLTLWHGSTKINPELFQGQVKSLSAAIQSRLNQDENAQASGIIVNTNGWIQDQGYELLLKTAEMLEISVILILGHDRLYSMMMKHYQQQPDVVEVPKVLKLPRSGGVISKSETFQRHAHARAIKRYFYGDTIIGPNDTKVPQLTPFALSLSTSEIQIFQLSSMALSSSLLPVAQQQTTDAIQMEAVTSWESLQHTVLAVCHPQAVRAYTDSGEARQLWTSGIAGVCTVESYIRESDTLSLLSPCAGSLPSKTFLMGDITWIE